ncbi:ribosome biogenesis GTPase Der [Halothermothrix orenii]|uniref:GTPase Der n=1 Tax=Halothermothrix orenii (strain H 168 / OCM 544 / DSM 9562) TaxID=373903 RepID=DER_HALOH|nr:ribosome biogenesis GTPase Der [Halothermothrix orenii]B8CWY9.1 RecName: Full=GTPase Der; AltName: Full=GTP-binding protein EngA [Halothermothrix orenii H 168]ACL69808.1 small GTP-binding protein [Halothermothrix orenii H 168]
MAKPVVAIVGRPNVGKSTLFNRLAGYRISIVEGEPNVTRDRIYADVNWLDRSFIIVDTGGIDPYDRDQIKNMVKYQAQMAIDEASLILFVVDGRNGLTATDEEVAAFLRKSNKKVILVVNKVDDFKNMEEDCWEFYTLGFDKLIPISAEHGKNTGDLLDEIVNMLPEKGPEDSDDDAIDVAIIGKPNVGKSSLVNYIVGQERVIVSDIPGTTRDAIDTLVEKNGHRYNLIDTAGLRKKSRVKEATEYYSALRTIKAIDRSDGVIMMIDALEGVTEQDKKIAGYAHEAGKAIVLAVNKWDLVEKDTHTMENYKEEIYYNLKFLQYAPVTFISALTGKRVQELLKLIEYVVDQNSRRVKTGLLNEVVQESIQLREPPTRKGKKLKIFYTTQVGIKPPTFVFFVNNPGLVHFAYQRYLENSLRDAFGFVGSPIRLKFKQKT